MFRKGECWYHTSTFDTALKILKVKDSTDTHEVVQAILYNRHNGFYYDTDTFYIRKDQVGFWKIFLNGPKPRL